MLSRMGGGNKGVEGIDGRLFCRRRGRGYVVQSVES